MLSLNLRPALVMLLSMSLLTGLVYPAVVTGLAGLIFPEEARGSLIHVDGRPVGSALIGQPFDDPRYFWGRPSATAPFPYNAAASTGSNLGPLNPALKEAITQRVAALGDTDPSQAGLVPVDLVTASASGLDPHISPAAALHQIPRVAAARSLPADRLRALVEKHRLGRTFGLLGEPRVNVLSLNLELDTISSTITRSGMTPSDHR